MPLDDYSKCLHELSKYEVRKPAGNGNNRNLWGIYLRDSTTRAATFLPGASGLQRALAVFFDEQEGRKAFREKKRKHDTGGTDKV